MRDGGQEEEPDFEILEAYLDGTLDEVRRREVEALSHEHADTRNLLEELRADREMAARLVAARPPSPNHSGFCPSIDGYSNPQPLHQGGQGAVFRAIQDSTQRAVAVKVLLPFSDRAQHDRFEREIDLVVGFSHPNLVTVFDRGTTAEGWPFFAMELLDALPIDEHVASRKHAVPAILRLFREVCTAVTYAHQRGVLHRDLKPANILAGQDDTPRLLDFGVAGSIEPTEARITAPGQFTGTLAYAAPEQLQGDRRDIDVRCDVYALGVILYQLLTGRLPYDVDAPVSEIIQNILTAPPARPLRRGAPLRRDLETILTKTLSKDRDRRYDSVADLARDITHFLAGDPIDARRDSAVYVMRKTMRKHWVAFSAAAVVLVCLTAATIISALFWQRSEAEALTTSEVNTFFAEMLYEAMPGHIGRDAKLVDVLDAVADRIDARFADRPRVAANLHRAIGRTYLRLDRFQEASRHLVRSRELHEQVFGARHSSTLVLLTELAELWRAQGKGDEALALVEEILSTREQFFGATHPETIRARANRATLWLDRGEHREAADELQVVVPQLESAFGELDKAHVGALGAWASALRRLREFDRAEALARQALNLRIESEGEGPNTQSARNSLAVILDELGRHAESVPLYDQIHKARVELHGPNAPRTLSTLNNLALAQWDVGKHEQAIQTLHEVRKGYLTKFGMRHPSSILTTFNLAHKLDTHGDLPEARKLYLAAEHAARQHLPKRHFLRLVVLARHGEFLHRQGELEAAAKNLRESFDGLMVTAKARHHETRRAGKALIAVYLASDRASDRAPDAAEKAAKVRAAMGPDAPAKSPPGDK